MKHLLIANRGLLEVGALTLLGASTKRGDNSKIGKFGSGNKYALAYFLRKGCKIRIFSGTEEIVLGLSDRTFREHDFKVLVVNGVATSITTEFGNEWSVWQAIRELYSNAMDEGMIRFGLTENDIVNSELATDDKETTTRIYIEATAEVEDFMFNIRDYIATGNEVLLESSVGKIYRKHSNLACVYYRGIRCYETNKESIYDYDLNNISLDENRLIRYSWELPELIWKMLLECGDKTIIRTLLHNIQDKKYLENLIDGDLVSLTGATNKEAWAESLEGSSICPRDMGGYVKDEDRASTLMLPGKLYNELVGVIGNTVKNKSFTISVRGGLYHVADKNPLIDDSLNKVMDFFRECGYEMPYKVIVVNFDNKNQFGGITENNEILISVNAFDKGNSFIAEVMIEEKIHIKHHVADKTREFQSAAINELITYMKLKNSFNL